MYRSENFRQYDTLTFDEDYDRRLEELAADAEDVHAQLPSGENGQDETTGQQFDPEKVAESMRVIAEILNKDRNANKGKED